MSVVIRSSRLISFLVCCVYGHGRLVEPPSRATMWRLGYNTPVNYNDNELFCGGFWVQYSQNGGKCGVCGDAWNGARPHETGGIFATGHIVRKYEEGQVIDVTVQLTANHKGYFAFYLCPRDDPAEKETDACLKKYPLKEEPGGMHRYPIMIEDGSMVMYDLKVRLPQGVKCSACVFRWMYNAGNNWGVDPDGTACIGCGNQEQFYGCADVAIGYDVTMFMPGTMPPGMTMPTGFPMPKRQYLTTSTPQNNASVNYNMCSGAHTFHITSLHKVIAVFITNVLIAVVISLL